MSRDHNHKSLWEEMRAYNVIAQPFAYDDLRIVAVNLKVLYISLLIRLFWDSQHSLINRQNGDKGSPQHLELKEVKSSRLTCA